MVALEADLLEALGRPGHQPLDHAAGVGSAVDVVAEKDDHLALGVMSGGIRDDLLDQVVQTLQATVHVAHRIEAQALRQNGALRVRLGLAEQTRETLGQSAHAASCAPASTMATMSPMMALRSKSLGV